MTHTAEAENTSSEIVQNKPNILKRIVRKPMALVASVALLGIGVIVAKPFIAEDMAAHERAREITAAAEAWANGNQDAFDGITKVTFSGLDSVINSYTADSTIGAFLSTARDEAGNTCAKVALNKGYFLQTDMALVRDGLAPGASTEASMIAADVCATPLRGVNSLIIPVGKAGATATIAWLNGVAGNDNIHPFPG